MILTGKCREDFNKWNYDNDFGYIDNEPTSLVVHFEDLDDNLKNTVIIEFFDNVGIIINVGGVLQNGIYSFSFDIQENNTLNGIDEDGLSTRQEATTEAIKKANEIYNNR